MESFGPSSERKESATSCELDRQISGGLRRKQRSVFKLSKLNEKIKGEEGGTQTMAR